MRFFHAAFEFVFGDVLNVLVERKHDTVARFRFFFNAGKPAFACVDGNHQLAGLALQLTVELALQAAESLIVCANVAENLRRQLALGIKTFGFFLKVNALQIQRADAVNHFRIRFPRNPTKSLVGLAVSEDDAGIVIGDTGNQADSIGQVRCFRGYNEGRIDLNGHRQLAAGAIVDDSAFWREIEAALLLALGAVFKVSITKDLEIDQTQADGQQPETKQSRQGVEPESCGVRCGGFRHCRSSRRSEKFGGPEKEAAVKQ